jgi:hypothetical protein
MSTMMVPANMDDAMKMLDAALGMQQCVLRFLAGEDAAGLPARAVADQLRALERTDAVESALRGRLLEVFDAQDGHLADGQRSTRAWLVHSLRVTRGQAAEYLAVQALARSHRVLHAALAEGWVITKSEALQLARWTRAIPEEYRAEAEEILVAAARAGVDLRGLAAICAEIRAHTAQPDPDNDDDPGLDRGVSLDTTFDGAGVVHGDLTPGCAAMVQAVLDALSAPEGGGDLRTRPQRYHDALAEAMKRLLASDLLPRRAGQPVKALVHIYFAELREMDHDGILQDKWITEYRARWAAHRAANSVSTGDGGAWLEGDAARQVACDAMIIPVVTGDIDPSPVEDLIALCVRFHQLRAAPRPRRPRRPRRHRRPRPSGHTRRHRRPGPHPHPGRHRPRPGRPRGPPRRRRRHSRRRPGRAGAADPGQDPSGRLRPRRRRVVPAPPPARQTPGRPLPPARRRADRRHPPPPAPPRGPAGPDMPVPRRL